MRSCNKLYYFEDTYVLTPNCSTKSAIFWNW